MNKIINEGKLHSKCFTEKFRFTIFYLLSFERPKESNKEKSPADVKLPKFFTQLL